MSLDTLMPDEDSRRLLFISHANPEDNVVASWFSTRLTQLGYEVWCDLKSSHRGESDFWLKVQQAIENKTAKFIFILSDSSRDFAKKKGIYKEVQAASDLRRENFIISLRTESLTGSVPIIIGPHLYINSENWAEGLRQLNERLVEDDIPRIREPNYEKIASWWPALGVEEVVVRNAPSEIVSNLLPIKKLPESIYLLKISVGGNHVAGYTGLGQALPTYPPHYAHGDYAISFACARDFCNFPHDVEIEDYTIIPTIRFIEEGCEASKVIPRVARNIVTFLVASTFEKYLSDKGLKKKSVKRSRRGTWYPPDGLINKNKYSIAEPGRRKVPVQLVGAVSYYTKRYKWHFGVQPIIDLYTFSGILFSPKAILTLPYEVSEGKIPMPVDEKKVLKKLGWWNKEWRQKLVAFSAWLSEGQDTIRLPTGYQHIELCSSPEGFTGEKSYLEKDDDATLMEVMSRASD